MRYIDVNWFHEFQSEPYRYISEIDEDNNEIRRLEFFLDGSIGYASKRDSSSLTSLSVHKIPDIEEINAEEGYQGYVIDQADFEELWNKHVV